MHRTRSLRQYVPFEVSDLRYPAPKMSKDDTERLELLMLRATLRKGSNDM